MSPTGWIDEANGVHVLDQDVAFRFGIVTAIMEILPLVTSFTKVVVIVYLI
jgi:hypothetical protein